MGLEHTELLVTLRTVVGFLGEREQHGWWTCSFFGSGSRVFLTPVFGRTPLLAQCVGVARAAALVHDSRIGVGHVFHLFRLPEAVEIGIHRALQQPAIVQRVAAVVSAHDAAIRFLQEVAHSANLPGVGPVRVGDVQSVQTVRTWRAVAGQYAQAFTTDSVVFPFFADAL